MLALVSHELEVADAIRRDILNECAELKDLAELPSQFNKQSEKYSDEVSEANASKMRASCVKTTPRMLRMADIMYKLKKTDFVIPG